MYKILSVDDEPINQAIIEELFSHRFNMAFASSGEECLANIEQIQPDLILLDVSMQGIDGYETCRELKKINNACDIPVIFVSARGTLEDQINGYKAGGCDYISKPFDHDQLEIKIKQIIEEINTAN